HFRDGIPAIHDLGSTNGTYVNGRNVTDSPLMPGDHLQLGKAVFLVHYVPDGEAAKTSRARQAAPCQIDPYESYHVFRMKLRGWSCSTN
ncbi:MAG: FHA domain-containing protein, partial [Pirellulaceae bacterium]|nr:FHA domain-containing protein [Pirellulaceae bacterium]